jgi:hypothetical protein
MSACLRCLAEYFLEEDIQEGDASHQVKAGRLVPLRGKCPLCSEYCFFVFVPLGKLFFFSGVELNWGDLIRAMKRRGTK